MTSDPTLQDHAPERDDRGRWVWIGAMFSLAGLVVLGVSPVIYDRQHPVVSGDAVHTPVSGTAPAPAMSDERVNTLFDELNRATRASQPGH